MKNYFRFGSNFIMFDHITAVKCSYYANQHCQVDQLIVYLAGGHDIPVPAIEQGRFLDEFQRYLDSFNDDFLERDTEKDFYNQPS